MASNHFAVCPTILLILSAVLFNTVRSSSITFGFETLSSSHFNEYENTNKPTVHMTLYWNTYTYQCILTPLSDGTANFCQSSNLHQTTECKINSSSTLPPYGLQIDISPEFDLAIDRILIQETDDTNTVHTLYDIDYFIIDSEAIDIVSTSASKKYIFFKFTSNNVYYLNRSSQCIPKSKSTSISTSSQIKSSNTVIVSIVAVIGLFICLFLYKHQIRIQRNMKRDSNIRPDENENITDDGIQNDVNMFVELVSDCSPNSIINDNASDVAPLPPLPKIADSMKSSQHSSKSSHSSLRVADSGQASMKSQIFYVSESDHSDGTLVYLEPDSRSEAVQVTMSALNTERYKPQMSHMEVSDAPSSAPEKPGLETEIIYEDEIAKNDEFIVLDEE